MKEIAHAQRKHNHIEHFVTSSLAYGAAYFQPNWQMEAYLQLTGKWKGFPTTHRRRHLWSDLPPTNWHLERLTPAPWNTTRLASSSMAHADKLSSSLFTHRAASHSAQWHMERLPFSTQDWSDFPPVHWYIEQLTPSSLTHGAASLHLTAHGAACL